MAITPFKSRSWQFRLCWFISNKFRFSDHVPIVVNFVYIYSISYELKSSYLSVRSLLCFMFKSFLNVNHANTKYNFCSFNRNVIILWCTGYESVSIWNWKATHLVKQGSVIFSSLDTAEFLHFLMATFLWRSGWCRLFLYSLIIMPFSLFFNIKANFLYSCNECKHVIILFFFILSIFISFILHFLPVILYHVNPNRTLKYNTKASWILIFSETRTMYIELLQEINM